MFIVLRDVFFFAKYVQEFRENWRKKKEKEN